jgi:hypothetical protein
MADDRQMLIEELSEDGKSLLRDSTGALLNAVRCWTPLNYSFCFAVERRSVLNSVLLFFFVGLGLYYNHLCVHSIVTKSTLILLVICNFMNSNKLFRHSDVEHAVFYLEFKCIQHCDWFREIVSCIMQIKIFERCHELTDVLPTTKLNILETMAIKQYS